jgi:hypothetical protein
MGGAPLQWKDRTVTAALAAGSAAGLYITGPPAILADLDDHLGVTLFCACAIALIWRCAAGHSRRVSCVERTVAAWDRSFAAIARARAARRGRPVLRLVGEDQDPVEEARPGLRESRSAR